MFDLEERQLPISTFRFLKGCYGTRRIKLLCGSPWGRAQTVDNLIGTSKGESQSGHFLEDCVRTDWISCRIQKAIGLDVVEEFWYLKALK